MLDNIEVTKEQLSMWLGYCGFILFPHKATVQENLTTLVTVF